MTTKDYLSARTQFRIGFERRRFGAVEILTAPALSACEGVIHGFTTRAGGVSTGGCASLNLCFSRDDSEQNVLANFEILCNSVGLDLATMALVNHEHGANVLAIGADAGGCGITRPPLAFSDGFVTDDPGVTLTTSHADCSAYFFFDPVTRSIGLCHAGWKGTLARIGANVVEAMRAAFGANPADVIACVAPCICGDCFEVDESLGLRVVSQFGADCLITRRANGKAYLDIEAAGAIQLLEAGISPANITLMNACTYEMRDDFFSYRRDKGITGSMIAFMKVYI